MAGIDFTAFENDGKRNYTTRHIAHNKGPFNVF